MGVERRDPLRPSITFEEITFSDGTLISLEPDDVVVLVGPNNAGKSAALRELEQLRPQNAQVIVKTKLRIHGNADDVITYLEENSLKTQRSGTLHYTGLHYTIQASQIISWWPGDIMQFRNIFARRVATETRITDSNSVRAIAILSKHLIRFIFYLQMKRWRDVSAVIFGVHLTKI